MVMMRLMTRVEMSEERRVLLTQNRKLFSLSLSPWKGNEERGGEKHCWIERNERKESKRRRERRRGERGRNEEQHNACLLVSLRFKWKCNTEVDQKVLRQKMFSSHYVVLETS